MSYSTPQQFRDFVDRATGSGARSTSQWGRSGAAQDANIQTALNSAAVLLNAAVRTGGLATPVTQASLGVDAAQWQEALAALQVCEMVLATGVNIFPLDDTPRVQQAREDCEKMLDLLRAGELLPTATDGVGGGFEYVTTTGQPSINFTSLSHGRMRLPIP